MIFQEKDTPFWWSLHIKTIIGSPPEWAHTSTHVIRTWIRLLANTKIKKWKKLFLLNTEEHHGHHWQSSWGTWLRSSQRMFYSCRGSEILALVLPCFYWNRIKLCVVSRLTGLFARCCLFCIWRFFTLHNGYESPSLAQLPRGRLPTATVLQRYVDERRSTDGQHIDFKVDAHRKNFIRKANRYAILNVNGNNFLAKLEKCEDSSTEDNPVYAKKRVICEDEYETLLTDHHDGKNHLE